MTSAPSKWDFYPITENSSGGGDLNRAVRAVYTSAVLLAREVIQNSWDAARKLRRLLKKKNIPFRVEFRFVSYTGKQKKALVEAMGLRELAKQRESSGGRVKMPSTSILDHLDDDTPLRVLQVSDYGAHGLYGQPQILNSESVMFNAIYFMGGSRKRDSDAGTGGSYGFGKAAFIRGSTVRTVFAYSAFQPYAGECNESDPVTRRLVGFCWWDNHKIGNKSFDGRGHFADLKNLSSGPTSEAKRVPFEDDAADAMAKILAIPTRDPKNIEELGTTLAIIDPAVTPEDLRAAVETYWWPALEDALMDVVIVDETGVQHTVDSEQNEGLRHYITAYRIARGDRPPVLEDGEKMVSNNWQRHGERRLDPGTCVVVAAEDGEADLIADQDDSVPEFLRRETSAVALMRDPRMVVTYRVFKRFRVPIKGVYVASADVDPLLGDTEPPLHNEWSTQASDDIEPESTEAVKSILGRITRSVTDFAAEVSPAPKVDSKPPSHYAALVSKFLRTPKTKGGGGKKKAKVEPISIEYPSGATAVVKGDKIATTATIAVQLADRATTPSEEVTVRFAFRILEDESETGGSEWPVSIKPVGKKHGFSYDSAEDAWIGSINKDRAVKFVIESDPYDEGWTGHLTPIVTRVGGSGSN